MTPIGNDSLLNFPLSDLGFWADLPSEKDLPPDPLYEELETSFKTHEAARNIDQFVSPSTTGNKGMGIQYLKSSRGQVDSMAHIVSVNPSVEPQKTPSSLPPVPQVTSRSNEPSLPSTSEKSGFQTRLSKRKVTQIESTAHTVSVNPSVEPQKTPSLELVVQQVTSHSNEPSLPSTSEKSGFQTRLSKRKVTQIKSRTPTVSVNPSVEPQKTPSLELVVQQVTSHSNEPFSPVASEKSGFQTRLSKRKVSQIESTAHTVSVNPSVEPQKTPSSSPVVPQVASHSNEPFWPSTSEKSGVQTRLSKRKVSQIESTAHTVSVNPSVEPQKTPSLELVVPQVASHSNEPSLPSTSEKSGVQTRLSKRKSAPANAEVQVELLDEESGEKDSVKNKEKIEEETPLDKALKSLRKNPGQSWDLLCRRKHISLKRFTKKAEAEGFKRNRVGGKFRKDNAAIEARVNKAIGCLRKNPIQSWNSLALKHKISYGTFSEKAEAAGFQRNASGSRLVSDSEKADIEVRMSKALEDLKTNPRQGWDQLAKKYKLSVDRFFERADEAGFKRNPKSISLTIDKADIEDRMSKALEDLKPNPHQSWGAVARKHGLGYEGFAARAEAEGFKRNPGGFGWKASKTRK